MWPEAILSIHAIVGAKSGSRGQVAVPSGQVAESWQAEITWLMRLVYLVIETHHE